jgi:DNA helicase II / ATP-dependent DNA helicase PcrA
MSHWAEIRARAREKHAQLAAVAGNDPSPRAILNAADTQAGVQRIALAAGDPLLYGAEACLFDGIIWFNSELEPWRVVFNQAHEYAHLWLHGTGRVCTDCKFNDEATEDESPIGVDRVEGYGPHERRELEANVFARELLLPTDLLKKLFLEDCLPASEIALKTGMPEGMVFHQLSMALFAPEAAQARESGPEPDLDASQKEAAHVERGPLLVKAGPGTGKTRTLVGRIVFALAEKNARPESVLALTYSNKAAEEMRSRVARVLPQEALTIWMGTFHAFGLEILRKYGTRINLPPKPRVVDPVDALYMLESELGSLDLNYYRDLIEPARFLPAILTVISRAKDELKDAEDYRLEAETMRRAAQNDDEIEAAEKALEVARVYAFYASLLEKAEAVDYGDLIKKSVTLLTKHSDIREALRKQYGHIVVDEYQDVNTASRMLLRELAGSGEGLWVVGDQLQAIYRFRGAAPGNLDAFAQDFPGARVLPLKVNYRSRERIVRTFGAFGAQMSAGGPNKFTDWKVDRSDGAGEIHYEVGTDEFSEAAGIASEIERQYANGVPYKHQAVLCRTHTGLAKLISILEARGIPLFYLGDLFERNEIRDLLSLLSLTAERKGSGLLRVSQFPEYQIPPADVLELLNLARDQSAYFPKALELAEASDKISADGKRKFDALANALNGITYNTSAWSTLGHYLFSRSDLARHFCSLQGVKGAQQRLAVYQFLQFAHRMRSHPSLHKQDPKRAFLDYVRRLELYGEEKQLRQPPTWASSIDAVRMLTVHAAKGLEFPVVYLALVASRRLPLQKPPSSCTIPPGLLPAGSRDWHLEEEQCLFFVGLSRARDALWLSRAERYGKQTSKASDFLTAIASFLPRSVDVSATLPPAAMAEENTASAAVVGRVTISSREADTYLKCPKQYFFDVVLGLAGRRTNPGYLQFHRCVYQVLAWMSSERAEGRPAEQSATLVKLEEVWAAYGPQEHAYAEYYRREAERLLSDAVGRVAASVGKPLDVDWEIPLSHGIVTIRPDYASLLETATGKTLTLQRWRTGKPPKKQPNDEVYSLYAKGAELAHPDAEANIEALYLSANQIVAIDLNDRQIKTGLEKYDSAVAGILSGEFPPTPSDWICPRCPHYFICPASTFLRNAGTEP